MEISDAYQSLSSMFWNYNMWPLNIYMYNGNYLETITCDPEIYTMDYSKYSVLSSAEFFFEALGQTVYTQIRLHLWTYIVITVSKCMQQTAF